MQKFGHKLKTVTISIALFFAVLIFAFVLTTDLGLVSAAFSENTFVETDLKQIAEKNYFGKFISASVEQTAGNNGDAKISFKLFNVFKIKRKNVSVVKAKTVKIGGDLIAMVMKPEGLIVTKISTVKTSYGEKAAFENGKLKEGDIMLELDGKKIDTLNDVKKVLKESEKEKISAKILRAGEEIVVTAMPQQSLAYEEKKLGIFLRDDFGGIGTLTYIDEYGRFGALGHSVSVSGSRPGVNSGRLTKAQFMGIEKADRGKAGEIKAYENLDESSYIGVIDKNCKIGIFGTIKNENYLKGLEAYEVGGRFSVKPGKAKIFAKVNGEEPQMYDIKILKTSKQQKSESRGIVIKVTDKKLLNKTGGIIQGMSGSPIIQNGKVVGAVTHVFLNDASKGYGVYVDFMLEQ